MPSKAGRQSGIWFICERRQKGLVCMSTLSAIAFSWVVLQVMAGLILWLGHVEWKVEAKSGNLSSHGPRQAETALPKVFYF